MYSIQHRHKVFLAQSVNKVIDNQLQTSEPTSNNQLTLILQRFANCYDNNPPTFVLDLLSTLLDYFFETFYYCKFVLAVIWFKLFGKWCQNSELPNEIRPLLFVNLDIWFIITWNFFSSNQRICFQTQVVDRFFLTISWWGFILTLMKLFKGENLKDDDLKRFNGKLSDC